MVTGTRLTTPGRVLPRSSDRSLSVFGAGGVNVRGGSIVPGSDSQEGTGQENLDLPNPVGH